MANFNPTVPDTNDPNWLGWSKGISQPIPDVSSAETINTIGTGIKEGLGVTDDLVKGYVKDQTYAETRKLQDEYTGSLEKGDISTRIAAAAGPGLPGTPATASATQTGVSALPPNSSSETPTDIKSLPSQVGLLGAARGNNKLSETAFYGRLTSLAKDLRDRYPGYRDYIDQEISRVSGVNPANAYIKSLLGDINSFATAGKEVDNKIRNELWSNVGIPGVAQILADYNAGKYGSPREAEPRIMAAIAPTIVLKRTLEMRKAVREDNQGVRTEVAVDAENEANIAARLQTVTAFNTLHLMSGSPTPQQLSQIVTDVQAGKRSLSEPQAIELAGAIRTLKVQASQQLDTYFNSKGKDGRTLNSILDPSKIDAIKKAHLQPFDDIADLIQNKEYGLAYRAMNLVRAMGDEDMKTILTDPEMGQSLRMLNVVNKIGSDAASKKALEGTIANNLIPKFENFARFAQQRMILQPSGPNGVVESIKKQIEDLDNKVNAPGAPVFSKTEVAKTHESILKNIDALPKINDPRVAEGLARAIFDPSNLGLLTKFDEDKWKDGKFIPGKFSVFNRMFNDDMARKMKSMSPDDWSNYKSLGKQMWGRELFHPFLQKLTDDTFSSITNHVKIGWDSDNVRFAPPVFDNSGVVPLSSQTYLRQNFQRLNNSLTAVVNIAKAEGVDPNTYVLGWLREFGVNVDKLSGIPKKMEDAIIQSKAKAQAEEEAVGKNYGAGPKPVTPVESPVGKINPMTGQPFPTRALQYNEENAPSSGSLGSFLSNPSGTLRLPRNNAPAASAARPRPILKGFDRTGNLSDIPDKDWEAGLRDMTVKDIPEGVSPQDFLRQQGR